VDRVRSSRGGGTDGFLGAGGTWKRYRTRGPPETIGASADAYPVPVPTQSGRSRPERSRRGRGRDSPPHSGGPITGGVSCRHCDWVRGSALHRAFQQHQRWLKATVTACWARRRSPGRSGRPCRDGCRPQQLVMSVSVADDEVEVSLETPEKARREGACETCAVLDGFLRGNLKTLASVFNEAILQVGPDGMGRFVAEARWRTRCPIHGEVE